MTYLLSTSNKIFVLCALLFASVALPRFLLAQSDTFNNQDSSEMSNVFSVGYGAPSYLRSTLSFADDISQIVINKEGSVSGVGPLYLKYERILTPKFGMGINVAYETIQYSETSEGYDPISGTYVTYTNYYDFSSVSILGRLSWHFTDLEKFDPYVGFGFGYRSAKLQVDSNDPYLNTFSNNSTPFPVGADVTIGARLYLSNSIGVYTELGLAKSLFQIGLAGRF